MGGECDEPAALAIVGDSATRCAVTAPARCRVPAWRCEWEDIVIGLPKQVVKDSMIDLLEAPGLGLDIDAEGAKKYLMEEDQGFFD
jgi:L-alanine-DL-glutamate epimerase-like enolase superfamily enzyme